MSRIRLADDTRPRKTKEKEDVTAEGCPPV